MGNYAWSFKVACGLMVRDRKWILFLFPHAHPNKPVMSLAGNNNALAHYEQSHGYDQISHAVSNITGAAVFL